MIYLFSPNLTNNTREISRKLSQFSKKTTFKFRSKMSIFKRHHRLWAIRYSLKNWSRQRRKSKTLKKFPEPADFKSLCCFPVMVNFYRKLIPQVADVLLPLTDVIKHNLTTKILKTNSTENKTFVTIIDILAQISTLTPTDPNADQYNLLAYSTNYFVGAALHRLDFIRENCLGKYSNLRRELFAAYQPALLFNIPCFQTISHCPWHSRRKHQ